MYPPESNSPYLVRLPGHTAPNQGSYNFVLAIGIADLVNRFLTASATCPPYTGR